VRPELATELISHLEGAQPGPGRSRASGPTKGEGAAAHSWRRIPPVAFSPRAVVISTTAALAGTSQPSHTPAPDRMFPSPHPRRSAPRAPTPDTAPPGSGARQPSGSRTARPQLPRRRAPSREVNGRSPRLGGVAPRPGSPYSFANQHAAPLVSDENHSASRTLTTNQPSVTGASPERRPQASLRSRTGSSQSNRRSCLICAQ
jgi:hypothetical protein